MTSIGIWLGLAAALVAAVGLGPLRSLLRHWSIIDRPNGRSSHRHPTPRGAGWLLVPIALVGYAIAAVASGQPIPWPLLVGALALMMISGVDDVTPLSPWPRLLCQSLAVALVLLLLLPEQRLFDGVPLAIERLAIGIAWLWYVNLFNFMDGLDGLSAIEILSVGGGVILIGMLAGGVSDTDAANPLVNSGFVLVGTACGFLIWNWHPARLFMGDVGSIPFGFLLGWILLTLAYNGHWAEALLLSLFHIADATSTLTIRLVRRERVWLAHREHAYQQPVRAGWPHDRVVGIVAAVKIGLVAFAVAVAAGILPAIPTLIIAVLMVFGVIIGFHRTSQAYPQQPAPALTDRRRRSMG